MSHNVACAAGLKCDDRRPCCKRFDHRNPKVLLADVDEAAGSLVKTNECFPRHPGEKFDVRWEPLPYCRLEGPDTDHRELVRQAPKCFEDKLGSLVGNETMNPQEHRFILWLCRRDVLDVNWCADDDRFAAADVVIRLPGQGVGATARLFAVDPAYIAHNPWVKVVSGSLGEGALLDQALRASPGFESADRLSIEIVGSTRPLALTLPVSGTVDLRDALGAWFAIPIGEVQGDQALVPRSLVIDYEIFERELLPALKAQLGTTTPVLNPGLSDLAPVSLENHISIDHSSYPSDPGAAAAWSTALRHVLERQAQGAIVIADDAYEPLIESSHDATNAKTLFILLGIPGVLAAAALGLAAQSALAEAHRQEDALLRLRGASDGQLARIVTAHATLAWIVGSALGLLVAAAAVRVTTGRPAWSDVPTGSLLLTILLALVVGALTTGIRLVRLLGANRRSAISGRRQLERGWQPLWRGAWLDLVAIALGVAILTLDLVSGGLRVIPIDPGQGSTLALRFYVLLGLVFLWVGMTLLAVRLLLAYSARRARPQPKKPLPSWRGTALRWLSRRPARTGVALVLGALAVAFGTHAITFVATYQAAKRAQDKAAFGSDLRLVPASPTAALPSLGPQVAATSPVRLLPARAGSDRKMIMVLDVASYSRATTASPLMSSGAGIEALAQNPKGVLIADEIAKDFEVGPGDPLTLTLFPDDKDLSRSIKLRVTGVLRSVPPTSPPTEMVMNSESLAAYLLRAPDFYLARTTPGASPGSVAADLRNGPLKNSFAVTTIAGQKLVEPRSLTALNLGPLGDLESVGAGLIASIGVAVLGAFLVVERRREYAILKSLGAEPSQIRTGPAQEGLIAVLGSIVIGVPVGLALGLLSVRVLGLFFTLPPPLLTIPLGTMATFMALMLGMSFVAIAGALLAVDRISAATSLRGS